MIGKTKDTIINLLEKYVALRFILAGGTSAFIDLFLLYLLNAVWGMHYIPSAIIAFVCAFGVSFTLHKFWTFRSHGESASKQATMYLGASLFSLFLNTLLMYIFVDYIFANILLESMKVKVMLSQLIVGAIVAVVSFFVSHYFVFKYKEVSVGILNTDK